MAVEVAGRLSGAWILGAVDGSSLFVVWWCSPLGPCPRLLLPLWRGPQELWCGAFHSVTELTRGAAYDWMNVWPGGEGR